MQLIFSTPAQHLISKLSRCLSSTSQNAQLSSIDVINWGVLFIHWQIIRNSTNVTPNLHLTYSWKLLICLYYMKENGKWSLTSIQFTYTTALPYGYEFPVHFTIIHECNVTNLIMQTNLPFCEANFIWTRPLICNHIQNMVQHQAIAWVCSMLKKLNWIK